MKNYVKDMKMCDHIQKELIEEAMSNAKHFGFFKKGFGQYKAMSKTRKIMTFRALTEEHQQRKNITELDFEGSGVWTDESKKLPKSVAFAESLKKMFGAKEIGKCMYALIKPGGTINYHTDSFPLYSGFLRFHVPLISEAGASEFFSEEGNFSMEQGWLYVYDTKPTHTTKNNSSKDRLHIIIDLLLDREDFFEEPKFYFDFVTDVGFVKSALSSDEFQHTQSKLSTVLFVVCETKDNFFFLWNSKKSRDMYFENCVLYKDTSESGEVFWKDSYQKVKDVVGENKCFIMRNDYEN